MTKYQKQKLANDTFRYSKKGVISTIYNGQKYSSKKRGHPEPTYTLDELRIALLAMPLFHELFEAWVDSGYIEDLKPSLDREDDSLPYTEDNIQLMAFKENYKKAHLNRIEGRENSASKIVEQFTLGEEYIATYHSASEAGRQTGVGGNNIRNCCGEFAKSAGGFKWKYAT